MTRPAHEADTAIQSPLRLLVVEDDPADRHLLATYLRETPAAYEVAFVGTLREALDHLRHRGTDVVLLDLGLPDSQGIETVMALRREIPSVPVVVLTGLDEDTMGTAAIQAGAQEFLCKAQASGDALERTLHYARERGLHERKAESERFARNQEREERTLGSLSPPASVAAGYYGRKAISEAAPGLMQQLSATYARLLELALETRVTSLDHDVSRDLRELADELGALSSGPRDVIEIHKTALSDLTQHATALKAQALADEGRYRLLELMGHLVSYYRRVAGTRGASSEDPRRSQEEATMGGRKA